MYRHKIIPNAHRIADVLVSQLTCSHAVIVTLAGYMQMARLLSVRLWHCLPFHPVSRDPYFGDLLDVQAGLRSLSIKFLLLQSM